MRDAHRPQRTNGTEPVRWSRWTTVKPEVRFSPGALKETLEGGQAFRWNAIRPGLWEGIWGGNLVRVRLKGNGHLEWSSPKDLAAGMNDRVAYYFAADMDLEAVIDSLPWRSDAVLRRVLEDWRGLRILRQPLEEALMAFLCSSNKQIVQIRQICEALANRLGDPIVGHYRTMPRWPAVSEAREEDLRACRTGYRARYLKGTADYLETHPQCLNEIDGLPHEAAVRALTALPGVGSKVADCVLLFGAFRIEAFPVDTWIARSMAECYDLHNWKPVQIAAFGRAHFGPYAGLAQQYLFAGARNG